MLLQIHLTHRQMIQPLEDRPQHTVLWCLKYSILFTVKALYHRQLCAAFNMMHRHMKQFYAGDIPMLCEVPLTESELVVLGPRLINLISRPLQVSYCRAETVASGHPFSRCKTAQSPSTSGWPTTEMALFRR